MMRDLVWTVIAIWVIYRLVSIFRNSPSSKIQKEGFQKEPSEPKKGKSRLDTEGEYVDYEEIR